MYEAAIVGMGVVSPVGLDAEQTAASIRAGTARKQESSIMDERFEPIVLGYLPNEVLPPLESALEARVGLTSLQRRLLRLAAPALQEAQLEGVDSSNAPILLAAPRASSPRPPIVDQGFFEMLEIQSGVSFAVGDSKVFPVGRAGLFQALQAAVDDYLTKRKAEFVWVGGVDSYVDLMRLSFLQSEGRLARDDVFDGFTPGEGAAFLLLTTRKTCERQGLSPLAYVSGVGVGEEEGHRYSDEPYLGEGLAAAVSEVAAQVARSGAGEPAPLVMAGLNGESFNAKEWGVAHLRNRELFAEDLQVEHPAEYTGDMGAALAPIMMGVAAKWMEAGHLAGPALVWASSDEAERGAAMVTSAGG